VRQGKAVIGWDQKFGQPEWRHSSRQAAPRRGIGVALVMQGTAIPYLDMGGCQHQDER
jgi:putative selenate reductase molybdopterin-binding subunit